MTERKETEHKEKLLFARPAIKLSPAAKRRINEILPKVKIDMRKKPTPAAWFDNEFDEQYKDYALEIGFGGGEHLARLAQRNPQRGFIGAEPFMGGVAKLLAAIERDNINNIKIYCGDGRDILEKLTPKSLAEIYLLYPDPWHKKRHHKRRFINGDNLGRIHRALAPRGGFIFASDIEAYVDWTLLHIRESGLFAITAQEIKTQSTTNPATRYEKKALEAGRKINYIRFKKK